MAFLFALAFLSGNKETLPDPATRNDNRSQPSHGAVDDPVPISWGAIAKRIAPHG